MLINCIYLIIYFSLFVLLNIGILYLVDCIDFVLFFMLIVVLRFFSKVVSLNINIMQLNNLFVFLYGVGEDFFFGGYNMLVFDSFMCF